jgi:hypothetical protein
MLFSCSRFIKSRIQKCVLLGFYTGPMVSQLDCLHHVDCWLGQYLWPGASPPRRLSSASSCIHTLTFFGFPEYAGLYNTCVSAGESSQFFSTLNSTHSSLRISVVISSLLVASLNPYLQRNLGILLTHSQSTLQFSLTIGCQFDKIIWVIIYGRLHLS